MNLNPTQLQNLQEMFIEIQHELQHVQEICDRIISRCESPVESSKEGNSSSEKLNSVTVSSTINTIEVIGIEDSGHLVEDSASNKTTVSTNKDQGSLEKTAEGCPINELVVVCTNQGVHASVVQHRDLVLASTDQAVVETFSNASTLVSNYPNTTVTGYSAATEDIVTRVEVPIAWFVGVVHNNSETHEDTVAVNEIVLQQEDTAAVPDQNVIFIMIKGMKTCFTTPNVGVLQCCFKGGTVIVECVLKPLDTGMSVIIHDLGIVCLLWLWKNVMLVVNLVRIEEARKMKVVINNTHQYSPLLVLKCIRICVRKTKASYSGVAPKIIRPAKQVICHNNAEVVQPTTFSHDFIFCNTNWYDELYMFTGSVQGCLEGGTVLCCIGISAPVYLIDKTGQGLRCWIIMVNVGSVGQNAVVKECWTFMLEHSPNDALHFPGEPGRVAEHVVRDMGSVSDVLRRVSSVHGTNRKEMSTSVPVDFSKDTLELQSNREHFQYVFDPGVNALKNCYLKFLSAHFVRDLNGSYAQVVTAVWNCYVNKYVLPASERVIVYVIRNGLSESHVFRWNNRLFAPVITIITTWFFNKERVDNNLNDEYSSYSVSVSEVLTKLVRKEAIVQEFSYFTGCWIEERGSINSKDILISASTGSVIFQWQLGNWLRCISGEGLSVLIRDEASVAIRKRVLSFLTVGFDPGIRCLSFSPSIRGEYIRVHKALIALYQSTSLLAFKGGACTFATLSYMSSDATKFTGWPSLGCLKVTIVVGHTTCFVLGITYRYVGSVGKSVTQVLAFREVGLVVKSDTKKFPDASSIVLIASIYARLKGVSAEIKPLGYAFASLSILISLWLSSCSTIHSKVLDFYCFDPGIGHVRNGNYSGQHPSVYSISRTFAHLLWRQPFLDLFQFFAPTTYGYVVSLALILTVPCVKHISGWHFLLQHQYHYKSLQATCCAFHFKERGCSDGRHIVTSTTLIQVIRRGPSESPTTSSFSFYEETRSSKDDFHCLRILAPEVHEFLLLRDSTGPCTCFDPGILCTAFSVHARAIYGSSFGLFLLLFLRSHSAWVLLSNTNFPNLEDHIVKQSVAQFQCVNMLRRKLSDRNGRHDSTRVPCYAFCRKNVVSTEFSMGQMCGTHVQLALQIYMLEAFAQGYVLLKQFRLIKTLLLFLVKLFGAITYWDPGIDHTYKGSNHCGLFERCRNFTRIVCGFRHTIVDSTVQECISLLQAQARSVIILGPTFIFLKGQGLLCFCLVVYNGTLVFFLWHIAWLTFYIGKAEECKLLLPGIAIIMMYQICCDSDDQLSHAQGGNHSLGCLAVWEKPML